MVFMNVPVSDVATSSVMVHVPEAAIVAPVRCSAVSPTLIGFRVPEPQPDMVIEDVS